MKQQCIECGGTKFVASQGATQRRRESDGLMEMVLEPEVLHCKACGGAVSEEEPSVPDKVLPASFAANLPDASMPDQELLVTGFDGPGDDDDEILPE